MGVLVNLAFLSLLKQPLLIFTDLEQLFPAAQLAQVIEYRNYWDRCYLVKIENNSFSSFSNHSPKSSLPSVSLSHSWFQRSFKTFSANWSQTCLIWTNLLGFLFSGWFGVFLINVYNRLMLWYFNPFIIFLYPSLSPCLGSHQKFSLQNLSLQIPCFLGGWSWLV